jgi:hypothetical protein
MPAACPPGRAATAFLSVCLGRRWGARWAQSVKRLQTTVATRKKEMSAMAAELAAALARDLVRTPPPGEPGPSLQLVRARAYR